MAEVIELLLEILTPQAALRGGCLLSVMAQVGREAKLYLQHIRAYNYFLSGPVSPSLYAHIQKCLLLLCLIQSG